MSRPSEKLSDNCEILLHSSRRVNGRDQAPDGYAWENGGKVPFILHPTLEPEPDFTDEQIRQADLVVAIMEWMRGSEAKHAAVMIWLGRDKRLISAIAADYKVSESIIHRTRKALEQFVRGQV